MKHRLGLALLLLILSTAPLAAGHDPHTHPHSASLDPGPGISWQSPLALEGDLAGKLAVLRAHALERLPAKQLLSLLALGAVLLLAWASDRDLDRRLPRRRRPVSSADGAAKGQPLPHPLHTLQQRQHGL